VIDRSIHGPSAYAEAALEPLRSIRLQFDLRPPSPFRLRRDYALAALGVGVARDLRPVAAGGADRRWRERAGQCAGSTQTDAIREA